MDKLIPSGSACLSFINPAFIGK